jgi:hypothetical protein
MKKEYPICWRKDPGKYGIAMTFRDRLVNIMYSCGSCNGFYSLCPVYKAWRATTGRKSMQKHMNGPDNP